MLVEGDQELCQMLSQKLLAMSLGLPATPEQ